MDLWTETFAMQKDMRQGSVLMFGITACVDREGEGKEVRGRRAQRQGDDRPPFLGSNASAAHLWF